MWTVNSGVWSQQDRVRYIFILQALNEEQNNLIKLHLYIYMLQALKEEQDHLMKLHLMSQRLATQQDIAFTLHNPLQDYLTQVYKDYTTQVYTDYTTQVYTDYTKLVYTDFAKRL